MASKYKIMLTSFALLSASLYSQEDCGTAYGPIQATVKHIEANGIGYKKGYTTGQLFISPNLDRSLPFIDLRGHIFNDGKWAANGGIGYRFLASHGRIYGANAYYDYRETSRRHYNQVGAGLETLGERLDFRINGYWPVGKRSSRWFDTKFSGFSTHNIRLKEKQEFVMRGANAEVGAHLNNPIRKGALNNVDFYTAIGPYYFNGKGKHFWGGRFRLQGQYKEYLSLEFITSYDKVFKDIYQGQIALNLPIGPRQKLTKGMAGIDNCSDLVVLKERIQQPVDRFEIIVADKRHKEFCAVNPCTGCPFQLWFVDNTSTDSQGSCFAPFNTLAQAQNASGPGDIIYVFPGDGTFTGMDQGFVFKDDQKLWSTSLAHRINTCNGKICIPTCTTDQPNLTFVTDSIIPVNVITIANNNEISGFFIQNINGFAIANNAGTSLCGLNVNNNTILSQGSNASSSIFLENVDKVKITSNHFNQTSLDPVVQLRALNKDIPGLAANVPFDACATGFSQEAFRRPMWTIARNTGSTLNENSPFIDLFIQNSSNVNTVICGNQLESFSQTIHTFVTNTVRPNLPNIIVIKDNQLKTRGTQIFDTGILSPGASIFSVQREMAKVYHDYSGNDIQSNARGVDHYYFDTSEALVASKGSGSCTVNESFFQTLGDPSVCDFPHVSTCVTDSQFASNGTPTSIANSGVITSLIHGNSTFDGMFKGNCIKVPGNFMAGYTKSHPTPSGCGFSSPTSTVTFENNRVQGSSIGYSDLISKGHVMDKIVANVFEPTDRGVSLDTSGSFTEGKYLVAGNQFKSPSVASVTASANGGASVCMRLVNDDTQPNSYKDFTNELGPVLPAISLTSDVASKFQLEPTTGVKGQIAKTNIQDVPAGTCGFGDAPWPDKPLNRLNCGPVSGPAEGPANAQAKRVAAPLVQ